MHDKELFIVLIPILYLFTKTKTFYHDKTPCDRGVLKPANMSIFYESVIFSRRYICHNYLYDIHPTPKVNIHFVILQVLKRNDPLKYKTGWD